MEGGKEGGMKGGRKEGRKESRQKARKKNQISQLSLERVDSSVIIWDQMSLNQRFTNHQ